MLFDPNAHEPPLEAAWSPAAVEAEIRAIAREAEDALRGRAWWPLHPLDTDPDDPEVFHGIYLGAAGVLWALDHLAQAGLHEPRVDLPRLAHDVWESYEERPEYDDPPSAWMGASGIALVAWRLAPSDALVDRIAELVAAAPEDDTLELLWGSPGLLLVADAMSARTGEERWASAWRALADHVLGQWPAEVMTQQLYGKTRRYLGAAHGLAGAVAALARRPDLLAPEPLLRKTTAAFSATAVHEHGLANWPPEAHGPLTDGRGEIRLQWCHGAPGVVTSAAALPRDGELDALLLAGGELIWAAGPLRKGVGLCHGTAGNGFALLKLFTRTGDALWLERARRFAMHAAAQVATTRREYGRGRHTLWTGDLGAAIYLQCCIAGTSELPALDVW